MPDFEVVLIDGLSAKFGPHVSNPVAYFAFADFFLPGDQGVALDMTSAGVMFQEYYGLTPVTAANQPVGLVLDESQGMVLGADQSGGDFSGWTGTANAILEVRPDGALRITAGESGGEVYAVKNISYMVGEWIRVDVELSARSDAANNALDQSYFVSDGNYLGGVGGFRNSLGVYSYLFKCQAPLNGGSADSMHARFDFLKDYGAPSPGDWIEIKNFRVSELPGNHASITTASLRPQYKTDGTLHWLEGDGVDDDLIVTLPASMVGPTLTIGVALKGLPAVVMQDTITDPVMHLGPQLNFNPGVGVAAYFIIDRALSTDETAALQALLNARAGL